MDMIISPLGSGAIAGLASCMLLQPFDLLKTRLQEESIHLKWSTRLFASFNRIWQVDGWMGFWRGTYPTILRNVPGSALYFVILNQLQYLTVVGARRSRQFHSSPFESFFPFSLPWNRLYDVDRDKMTNIGNMLTGSISRVTAGLLLMPMTIIKVRYESSKYLEYTSISKSMNEIWKREGLRGFFIGFGATTLRDAPHAGIYVAFYEAIKRFINQEKNQRKNHGSENSSLSSFSCNLASSSSFNSSSSLLVNMTSGLIAGFMATLITQPFDLIKTRIQVSPLKHVNMLKTILIVAREEGIMGFFSGMFPRLARKTLGSAITWTVYEEIRRLDRNKR